MLKNGNLHSISHIPAASLIPGLAVVFLSCLSCEGFYYPGQDYNKIPIQLKLDWSELPEQPEGMTTIFYPHNGDAPIQWQNNQTNGIDVVLPKGKYDIIVFNLSPNEYSSFSFFDLKDFNSAQVSINEQVYQHTSYTLPPLLATIGYEHLDLTFNETEPSSVSFRLTPHLCNVRTTIRIAVKNLVDAKIISGTLHGMAKTVMLGSGHTNDEQMDFPLVQWERQMTNDKDGFVTTTISTFGQTSDESELSISLNFAMSDGTTNYRATIRQQQFSLLLSAKNKLVIETALPETLPHTEAAISGNGYEINVDDWIETDSPTIHI